MTTERRHLPYARDADLPAAPTCLATGDSLCRLGMAVEDCETVQGRIVWLITVRWFAIIAALAGVGLGSLLFPFAAAWAQLGGLVALLALVNSLWHVRAKRKGTTVCAGALRFAYYQILADFALLTIAVHLTGGVVGPLTPLFVMHGVFSAVLLPRRASIATLIGAVCFMSLALALGGLGKWSPPWHFSDPAILPSWAYDLIRFGFLGTAVGGSSLIGMQLSHRLRLRHAHISFLARELERRNAELRRVDEQRVRLLGAASHDLKSPLAAVESRLDVLIGGYLGPVTPQQEEQLHKMKSRMQELRYFITDLLDYTAVVAKGFRPVEPRPVDIVEQLKTTMQELSPVAEHANWSIEHNLPDKPIWVHGPPRRLSAVWLNLLSNAIKYGVGGKCVSIKHSVEADLVHIEIVDHGLGISEEDQQQLFREFFRTNAAKSSGIAGTGLGLAIVKQVIDDVGGNIEIRSRVGEGTTVKVSLSMGNPASPDQPSGPAN